MQWNNGIHANNENPEHSFENCRQRNEKRKKINDFKEGIEKPCEFIYFASLQN